MSSRGVRSPMTLPSDWHQMDCEKVNGDKPCRCNEPNYHVGAFRVWQWIWKTNAPFLKFEKDLQHANGVLN